MITKWFGGNGRLWGCYLHGIFANDNFRHAWFKSLGHQPQATANQQNPFDHLADVVESSLDMEKLSGISGGAVYSFDKL